MTDDIHNAIHNGRKGTPDPDAATDRVESVPYASAHADPVIYVNLLGVPINYRPNPKGPGGWKVVNADAATGHHGQIRWNLYRDKEVRLVIDAADEFLLGDDGGLGLIRQGSPIREAVGDDVHVHLVDLGGQDEIHAVIEDTTGRRLLLPRTPVDEAARRRRISRHGAARDRADEAAANMRDTADAIPAPASFADLVAAVPATLPARIERALFEGGRALFLAGYKVGKTTTVGNLAKALADGTDFLGAFPVKTGRVAVLDFELSPAQGVAWLRDLHIEHTERVDYINLRGAADSFDLRDPNKLGLWARRLRDADVLVVDCLTPIIRGLGLNENTDKRTVLDAIDSLALRAGIGEVVVVDHLGHKGRHARGDSGAMGWPDAVWSLDTADPNDPDAERSFEVYGRDVRVERGVLDFAPETRRLTYTAPSGEVVKAREAAKAAAKVEAAKAAVLAYIAGANARNDFPAYKTVGEVAGGEGEHSRSAVREAAKVLEAEGRIVADSGPRSRGYRVAAE